MPKIKYVPADPRLAKLPGLTPAQYSLIECFVVEPALTTEGLARKLCVSPSTIKAHFNGIFERLNVHTRAEIMAYWLDGKHPGERAKNSKMQH